MTGEEVSGEKGHRYKVVVPVRTTQTFIVYAASPTGAKRKVNRWLHGERDEQPDLECWDDIGMVSHPYDVRAWDVTTADFGRNQAEK